MIGGHYHLGALQTAVDLGDAVVLAGLEEALDACLVAEAPGSPLVPGGSGRCGWP